MFDLFVTTTKTETLHLNNISKKSHKPYHKAKNSQHTQSANSHPKFPHYWNGLSFRRVDESDRRRLTFRSSILET